MTTPLIQTQTQWGNNIVINVYVTVKDDKISDSFFQNLSERLLGLIRSTREGKEMWENYGAHLAVVHHFKGIKK